MSSAGTSRPWNVTTSLAPATSPWPTTATTTLPIPRKRGRQLGDAPAEHNGISEFGERAIAEMNRLGIMVDISHISKAAALDAIRLSRAPVIASHSNTLAITDHPRNMDDETLLALRDNGGVMQATALAAFVKALTPALQDATRAVLAEYGTESFRDWFRSDNGTASRSQDAAT